MVAPGHGYGIVAMAALGYGGPQSVSAGLHENYIYLCTILAPSISFIDVKDAPDKNRNVKNAKKTWQKFKKTLNIYYNYGFVSTKLILLIPTTGLL